MLKKVLLSFRSHVGCRGGTSRVPVLFTRTELSKSLDFLGRINLMDTYRLLSKPYPSRVVNRTGGCRSLPGSSVYRRLSGVCGFSSEVPRSYVEGQVPPRGTLTTLKVFGRSGLSVRRDL